MFRHFTQMPLRPYNPFGAAPELVWTHVAPNFSADPFTKLAIGSMVVSNLATTEIWQKVSVANGDAQDWVVGSGMKAVRQTITRAQLTDVTTTGTIDLDQDIPAGAYVLRTTLTNVTGFIGDTSATIQVGDGTDVDRYSTGTPSVFTTAVALDVGAVSGTAIHVLAKTPKITITSAADFTDVSAGAATVNIFYMA